MFTRNTVTRIHDLTRAETSYSLIIFNWIFFKYVIVQGFKPSYLLYSLQAKFRWGYIYKSLCLSVSISCPLLQMYFGQTLRHCMYTNMRQCVAHEILSVRLVVGDGGFLSQETALVLQLMIQSMII